MCVSFDFGVLFIAAVLVIELKIGWGVVPNAIFHGLVLLNLRSPLAENLHQHVLCSCGSTPTAQQAGSHVGDPYSLQGTSTSQWKDASR